MDACLKKMLSERDVKEVFLYCLLKCIYDLDKYSIKGFFKWIANQDVFTKRQLKKSNFKNLIGFMVVMVKSKQSR